MVSLDRCAQQLREGKRANSRNIMELGKKDWIILGQQTEKHGMNPWSSRQRKTGYLLYL
jgi:hypothetical protein